ncbi:MAG: ankyrin repeat domain-containing protein [Pseudomonadota bacterium]
MHFASCGCGENIIDFLIANGAIVNYPNNESQSAFILAARENNVDALRALARHGADINRPCTLNWAEGRSALGVLLLEQQQGYGKPESIDFLESLGATEWPDE